MSLASLKRELLLVHGLRVELGQRVGRAAERRVHRPIHLVQARRHRLPLLPHLSLSLLYLSPPSLSLRLDLGQIMR